MLPRFHIEGFIAALLGLMLVSRAAGQFPSSSPTPAGAPPSALATPPPHEIPLVEKKWDELSNRDLRKDGETALAIRPDKWKHAESENFIIHFRRYTEARKVVREIEYDLWFIATSLGATKDQYRLKSHVFVFEDQAEWNAFVVKTDAPMWASSFASFDGLFLNIRQNNGILDSHTLAHETTHAVVARLYPRERWPVWLNEGFAEYMGGASVAARNHQSVKIYQHDLKHAEMSLEELFALKVYPEDYDKVGQLYQTGEKFVRFLMNGSPKERFRSFVTELLASNDPRYSILKVYGDQFKDFDVFKTKFAHFSK